MSKNKTLGKKRARKAEKRRQRRGSTRTQGGRPQSARSRPTQSFPTPDKFAIDSASISELQTKLVEGGPLNVLSMLSLEILFGGEGTSRIWLSVEHPTWLTLVSTEAWARDRAPNPIEYGEINKLVDEHVEKTHGRLMAHRVHATGADLALQHLLIEATSQHLNVRKLVFRFQAREEASKLFSRVGAEMSTLLGFEIGELLAVEEAIETIIVTRGDAWWKRKGELLGRLTAALDDEAVELEGEEGEWLARARSLLDAPEDIRFMVAMQWCLSTAASVFLVTASELATAAGIDESVARAVLRQFSIRAPQAVIADSLPSLYEPLELRPMVQVDDDRWLLHLAPPKLTGAIRPNLEKELKPTAAWERYQHGRADYLETRAVELLKNLSPHAKSWVGLKYRFDDGSGPQDFELDGLVLIDTVAFLVEGKAGALRLASRRGQSASTVENIKALAFEAHDQALRARRYIEQSGNADFRVGSQRVQIQRSLIREFVLVTTTLEILSAFLTRTYDLVQTGLLSPGQLPWAVALPELELICDLSEGAGQLVHYVRRRLDLGRREISAAEELDWFGNYLHEGLFFDDDDYVKYDAVQLGDFAAPINAYYEALHDTRHPPAPKPKQVIPEAIALVIQDLEEHGPAGFIEAVKSLLDGNGAARKRLAEGISHAKAVADRKGFGGFRMKMASAVVVLSFHRDEPDREHLAGYVKATKYSKQATRAVGIAQSVRTRSQILVAIEEGTFVSTTDGDAQALAFLSSLKTREEQP